MMDDDDELIEKRIALRQKLKSQLLTLSPPRHACNVLNNFIPNSRDSDFIEKQGLDCALTYLTKNPIESDDHSNRVHLTHWPLFLDDNSPKRLQTRPPPMPHICSICRTDATQNWWHSRNETTSTIYLCDLCERARLRRMIIEQHRESMKSAFFEAKESERRLEVDYRKQHKKRNTASCKLHRPMPTSAQTRVLQNSENVKRRRIYFV